MADRIDLNDWLSTTELVVCVGSGGVGKTTTAATLGLWAATRGRKAMVLTIDPARRLANSLGLERMGGEPTRIGLSSLPDATGELWAMMLDSRSTFDNLIAAVAPSEEVKQRIFDNHIYQHMADALAGSQDYMATETLHDLLVSEDYDLIILDTPPVKNALDFLESPGRVVEFLDERVLSWFLAPYEKNRVWGARLLAGTQAFMFRLLGYVFGREFLDDFAEFLQEFSGLYEGFRTRHERVLSALRADGTQFLTVCAPTSSSVDVATFFQHELAARDLPRAGVLVNQVHRCEVETDDAQTALGALADTLADDLPPATASRLVARLGRAHQRLRDLVAIERELAGQVRESAAGVGWYTEVPRFEGEVHDLQALLKVGAAIFAEPAEPA